MKNPLFRFDGDDVISIMEEVIADKRDPYDVLEDEYGFDAHGTQRELEAQGATVEQIAGTLGGIMIGFKLCEQHHG